LLIPVDYFPFIPRLLERDPLRCCFFSFFRRGKAYAFSVCSRTPFLLKEDSAAFRGGGPGTGRSPGRHGCVTGGLGVFAVLNVPPSLSGAHVEGFSSLPFLLVGHVSSLFPVACFLYYFLFSCLLRSAHWFPPGPRAEFG